jgi:hypothetical protein
LPVHLQRPDAEDIVIDMTDVVFAGSLVERGVAVTNGFNNSGVVDCLCKDQAAIIGANLLVAPAISLVRNIINQFFPNNGRLGFELKFF